MNNYVKPIIEFVTDKPEGIYMSSGVSNITSEENNKDRCNSVYMRGDFVAPDYSTNNYLNGLGCNGCPAFRPNGCALQLEYLWGSYDVDDGHRMPEWERNGYGPYDKRY